MNRIVREEQDQEVVGCRMFTRVKRIKFKAMAALPALGTPAGGLSNESSVYAQEGSFAHEICEYKVRKYLHERVKRPQSEEFDTDEIENITDVVL
jgi:hypothetical protein